MRTKTVRPDRPNGPGIGLAPEPPAASAEGEGPGREARCLAAAVLEVLAGFQTPSDAARGLGISLARYYQLEVRALDGLVEACTCRRGRGGRGGSELVQLRRECERLRRECARQQALVRATRRTVGLAPAATPVTPPADERPRHRKRRPTARALKAVAQLRRESDTDRLAATAPSSNQPEAQKGGTQGGPTAEGL